MRPFLAAFLVFLMLPTVALAQSFCSSPFFPRAESHIVIDDGNNLRQWGGDNYASAPILAVLNTGDEVRVLSRDGKWAEVETPEGLHGFMSVKFIAPYDQYVRSRLAQGDDFEVLTCSSPTEYISRDLDGDGVMETLRLTCEPGLYCSNAYLDVLASNGSVLFQGPRNGDSPFIFCECHDGIYHPDIVADLNGDGMAELLLARPQSDVSPAVFDMYTWHGSGFTPTLGNFSLTADRGAPQVFHVTPALFGESLPPYFIFALEDYGGGQLKASISSQDWQWGEALVRFDGRNFVLERWLTPLHQ